MASVGRDGEGDPTSVAVAAAESTDMLDSYATEPAQGGRGLRQTAAKGIAWTGGQTLASGLMQALTFIVLARLLQPAAFGVVAFASVAVALLTIFVTLGFAQALVQRPVLERRHVDTAFWISLTFGAVMAAGLVGLSGPIAAAADLPAAGPVLRVLSIGFLLAALASVPRALLQRRMAFRPLAMRLLFGNVVGAVVSITAALMGAGAWSLVLQTLCSALAELVVVWRVARWRPRFSVDKDACLELFRFGSNVVGSRLMMFLHRRTDDFFIGAFLGAVALGVYGVAYNLLLVLMDVFVRSVGTVAMPTFARLQHDPGRLRSAFFSAKRMTAAIAVPVFLFMAAAAPEVIDTLVGARWHDSIPVLRVLALIGVLNAVTAFNGAVLTALGRPDLVLRFMLVTGGVNVLVVAVAVHWGLVAVAAALVLRNALVGSPLSTMYTRRVVGFSYGEYARTFITPLLAGGVMVVAVLLLHAALVDALGSLPRLLVMTGCGALAYLGSMWLFDRRLLRELMAHVQAVLKRQPRRPAAVAA